jgi:eukaryotic-like serine/threonine-protein kinase
MLGQVVLGRYQIVRLLGEGGMGRVFLARAQDSGQEVVVKVLHGHHASDSKFRELFLREMEYMAHFRHPNVVQFYDAAVEGPQGPCIVMEYVAGSALDVLLKSHGRFDPLRVGKWLGQICSALQYAHAIPIIHRDLKPANLMVVDPAGPNGQIKIMDFGLSQLTAVPHFELSELRGGAKRIAGTPEYLSPEQARGDQIDRRSDLYAVGLILFEALTGRRPFSGQTTRDLMLQHSHAIPPTFAKVGVTDVPPAIEAVVQRCLYKYAAERPHDAGELAQLYERALGEKITVDFQPGAPPQAAPPAAARRPPQMPGAIVYTLQAWMPEKIAVLKLQGFLQTAGGEVVRSEPGLVRVRFAQASSLLAKAKSGFFAKLVLGKRASPPPPKYLHMDMYMEKRDPAQPNQLTLTLVLHMDNGNLQNDLDGLATCEKICSEICGYLMAKRAP